MAREQKQGLSLFLHIVLACCFFLLTSSSIAHAATYEHCFDRIVPGQGNVTRECVTFSSEAQCQASVRSIGNGSCTEKDEDRAFYDIAGHLEDFGDWLIAQFLAVFVSLAGGLLAVVGVGFDQAVKYTIVDFGTTYSVFEPGVNAAWAGFRDVANIIMIAMFIFVAFAVILNSETYGIKRFGVRILIVAVLINFSLFFTKAIIDVSNVTAIQFRQAIQVKDSSGNDAGIAAAFMQQAGLTESVYISASTEIEKIANNSWGRAFLYTFLTVIFFAALLVVLLYGLILLIARVVIFIILMLTSAAAFAAYMVPRGQKWWDKWWSELIRNALFAPVFMMMLWGVVKIMNGFGGDKKITFDQLVAKSSNAWEPAFAMMLVVGLLYGSTKVANELSIAGASFANKVSTKGFSSILRGTLGTAFGLTGALGRRYVGAAARSRANDTRLRQQAVEGNFLQRMNARGQLAAARRLAATSFDFRDTKIAKNLEKTTGGLSAGKGVGSYDAYEKKELGYVADAAKAAGEDAKAAAEAVRDSAGEAPMSAGGSGDAEKMAAMLKESAEKNNQTNQQAINAAVGAQRQANTQTTLAEAGSTEDSTSTDTASAASKGQQEKNKLAGQDSAISSLASDIQERERQKQAETIAMLRQTIGGSSNDIPTARGEGPAGGQGGSPDVVEAIQGLRGDLQRQQQAASQSTSKKPEDIAKDASKAFLQRYRETSGITRDRRSIRDRIYGKASGEIGKSSSDKANEEIQSKLEKIEKAQNKDN